MDAGATPASASAISMQRTAPEPSGDGAVMWCASAVDAEPSTSPQIRAPRALAASHSSSTSTPAPSAMTKPSRSTSYGREMPLDDSAVMLENPATPVGVIAASEPPVITASQMPSEMRRAALPMAWVLAAHAVTVDSHGPRQPNRIDTVAAAALLIIIGTRNGD